ncbi:hypothetical protein, partial [Pseudomonas putida]
AALARVNPENLQRGTGPAQPGGSGYNAINAIDVWDRAKLGKGSARKASWPLPELRSVPQKRVNRSRCRRLRWPA